MAVQRYTTNMDTVNEGQKFFEQGGDWFQLKDGKNIIRVLPPWSAEGRWFKLAAFHRAPQKISDKALCLNATFNQNTCPICRKQASVAAKYGKDFAKNYNATRRAFINVLDMQAADGVVRVLEIGSTILNVLMNHISENGNDDLLDPNLGFNISITRGKGKNGFTEYQTTILTRPYDLAAHGYDVDHILSSLPDLSRFATPTAEDKVYELLDVINAKTFENNGGLDESEDTSIPSPAQVQRPQAVQPASRPQPARTSIADDVPSPARRPQTTTQAQPARTPTPVTPAGRPAPQPLTDDYDIPPARPQAAQAPRPAAPSRPAPVSQPQSVSAIDVAQDVSSALDIGFDTSFDPDAVPF